MPEIEANGLLVHYESEGQGPPLLMLHGATSMGTHDWGSQRPILRSLRTLYMPDARSHHRTVWDVQRGWSSAQLVEDALAFADALGLQRFHVMGLSMGARTALELATREPDRVLSLLLIGVAVEGEPAASVARRRLDPSAIERDDPGWTTELIKRHDTYQGSGAWRRLAAAIREDSQQLKVFTPEELHRVRTPVLLAFGDRDPWVPLEQAVRLKRQLPNSGLLLVPDCGHVVEAERPSIFNPAMSLFLRRTEGAS
jgi:pimeloyl-ACP methyl ester carboxylesterase